MEILERLFNITLIVATLRTTAPILLVALGGSFTTKAGIFNIGLEGQMLVGAFFAVIGTIFSGSPWIGMLCGVLAALVLALIFAVLVVSFKANEVVVGLALNILAGGMTISLLKAIFGTRGSIFGHGLVGLPAVKLPYARDLGWFGQMLSGYTPLVYAAFILVPLLILFYNRTRLGLYIRVVGEKPEAAEALGISIVRIRYTASLLCGVLAGLAGAHLSLGYTTMFTENMSSGRGFMAVAILIFSNGDPLKIVLGCLLFGFSDALSLRLQTMGVSSYLVLAVPYLVALAALFALSYRARPRIIQETLATMGRALSVKSVRTRRAKMERIILDVNSAGDDILAVLFTAASPDLKLEGVTTVTGAAGGIDQVTNVVLNTLSLAGREDIPVAAGAWRPIVGNAKADMEAPVHFEKRLVARFGDRLKNFNPKAPPPNRKAVGKHAVDFILDTVRAAPGEITLVTTGPLTNAAMVFLQEPNFGGLLKRLIVLGGTFTTPGNMTPVTEYNIWADPEASRIVLNADVDKILVPLDVCEDNRAATGMMTRDDIADMTALAQDNPVVAMIEAVFPIYIDIWREFFDLVGFPMDDVITAALAFAPDLCTMTEPLFVDVVLDGRIARGQTVAYRGRQILPGGGAKTTRICTGIDGRRFLSLFKSAIGRYERGVTQVGTAA